MQTTDHIAAQQLYERIKLPSATARHLGKKVLGRPYKVYPWVAYMEQQIIEMLNRPGREVLIINLPPQQGKSTFCSMWLPFWYLGMNPDDQVILVAYNGEYAGSWGRKVRDIMQMYGQELFGVGLNKSVQTVNDWKTDRGFGGMLSAGIDGGITGNPGHLIIIDDVIKNMMEAGSPTTLRHHLEEWDGSVSARFQENTKVLITATRWAEGDLSGEIEARSKAPDYKGIPVRRINLKAIAEPDDVDETQMSEEEREAWRDPIGRRIGEHLQGQHSRSFFLEKKAGTSQYVWSALYQGDPTSRTGSMFPKDRWAWFDPDDPPEFIRTLRVWDLAATEGGGDWTCGAKVAKGAEDNHIYVLDMQRFQKKASDVTDAVKLTALTDGPMVGIRAEQERQGSGKSVMDFYDKELLGYDFEPVKAEGEKVSRFRPYADFQQRQAVHLPRFKDGTSPAWVQAFIEEHRLQMPDGRGPRNDDQIDTVAYAVLELHGADIVELFDPAQQLDLSGPAMIQELADRHDLTVFDEESSPLARIAR